MLKSIFFIILLVAFCSAWTKINNTYPAKFAYHKGTTDYNSFTYENLIRSESTGGEQGSVHFDISSFSDVTTILEVGLNIYASDNSGYPFLFWQGLQYEHVYGSGTLVDHYQICFFNNCLINICYLK